MRKKKTPEALAVSRELHRTKAFGDFLRSASERYNNKFDYSKFIYVDAKTKGIIICPAHGEFLQNSDKHLTTKYGCAKCWHDVKGKSRIGIAPTKTRPKITKETFLDRANKKYNNKFTYDLTNFAGRASDNKILVTCPIHGSFETTVANHIINNNTYGCNNCAKDAFKQNRTGSYDKLLKDFRNIHGDKYIYPESNREIYVNRRSKIEIECSLHGTFIKSAQKHISGQACNRCRLDQLIKDGKLPGDFNLTLFEQRPKLKKVPAILYYLKINDGQYYKIGITTTKVEDRIKGLKCRAQEEINNIEILYIANFRLFTAFKIEQKILKKFYDNRIFKKWSTELFDRDIYKDIEKYFT
jgi:hypothetical protein